MPVSPCYADMLHGPDAARRGGAGGSSLYFRLRSDIPPFVCSDPDVSDGSVRREQEDRLHTRGVRLPAGLTHGALVGLRLAACALCADFDVSMTHADSRRPHAQVKLAALFALYTDNTIEQKAALVQALQALPAVGGGARVGKMRAQVQVPTQPRPPPPRGVSAPLAPQRNCSTLPLPRRSSSRSSTRQKARCSWRRSFWRTRWRTSRPRRPRRVSGSRSSRSRSSIAFFTRGGGRGGGREPTG